jgi:8-oxo-dGTP diphosphatase
MKKNFAIPNQLLGTCVIVLSKDGKNTLLGKRKNSYQSGFYGLPGGRVEGPEKLIDCARRELKEETELTAKSIKFLGVIRDFRPEGYTFTHFAFLCKEFNGEPKVTEPNKCEEWKWFEIDKIPKNTLIGHLAAIEILLNPDKENLKDVRQ